MIKSQQNATETLWFRVDKELVKKENFTEQNVWDAIYKKDYFISKFGAINYSHKNENKVVLEIILEQFDVPERFEKQLLLIAKHKELELKMRIAIDYDGRKKTSDNSQN